MKKEKKPINRKTIIILSIIGAVLILVLCALFIWKVYFSEKDYEGGLYEGADVTVKLKLVTKEQGIFTSRSPWGISK